MTAKPNFIGIGGQKCASTWLSECLRAHPEVFMSSPKELRYFADNCKKGFDWYLKYFESSENYKCRGEFSSNYIYHLESAKKIKKNLGKVKIIAVAREPVDRALSHIKHLIRDGDIPKLSGKITEELLKDILKSHPKVLSNSLYQPGLSEFRKVFGKNAVFVVSQSTCRANSQKVLKSLWGFLGVSNDVELNVANKVVSVGINPRFFWLESLRRKIFSFTKYRFPELINRIKKTGLPSLYRKLNSGDSVYFSEKATLYLRGLSEDDWASTQAMLSIG